MRNFSREIRFDDIARQVSPADRAGLGPFVLAGVWRVTSPNSRFGGFSALIRLNSGQFRAMGDRNVSVKFTPPDRPGPRRLALGRAINVRLVNGGAALFDVEAAFRTPEGDTWFGLEANSRFYRIARGEKAGRFVHIPEMVDWPINGGAEAIARLRDGRWIALCETCGGGKGGLHLGLLFPQDPGMSRPERFGMTFPAGFDPVDAATLPDGRLLILARRLALFPPHFGSLILLADPAEWRRGRPWPTHVLARIDGRPLRENYEGMVLEPAGPASLALWLVSDDNSMLLQETRLIKLLFDPAALH